jgi:hypothetical protein
MPITEFSTINFHTDGTTLSKGDPLAALDFFQAVEQRITATGAGRFLQEDYQLESHQALMKKIRPLEKRDDDAQAKVEGAQPLDATELAYLERLRKRENSAQKEEERMITACGPVKDFIDQHIHRFLTVDVRDISTNRDMKPCDQVRDMLQIIAEKCLGNPTTCRNMLMDRMKNPGLAKNPGEVLQVINNMELTYQQLKTHQTTVRKTINKVATEQARKTHGANSPDIFYTCQELPTRDELAQLLTQAIDPNSAANSSLRMLLSSNINIQEDWPITLAKMKQQAEYEIAAHPQYAPPASSQSGGASVSSSSVASSHSGGISSSSLQTPGLPTEQTIGVKRQLDFDQDCTSPWDARYNKCEYSITHSRPCRFRHPLQVSPAVPSTTTSTIAPADSTQQSDHPRPATPGRGVN